MSYLSFNSLEETKNDREEMLTGNRTQGNDRGNEMPTQAFKIRASEKAGSKVEEIGGDRI